MAANMPISQVFVGQELPISAKLLMDGESVQDAEIKLEVSMPAENFQDVIAKAETDLKALSEVKTSDATWELPERKAWVVYKGKPLQRKKTELVLKSQPVTEKRDFQYAAVLRNIDFPGNYDFIFRATWITEKNETVIREWNRTVLVKAKPSLKNSRIRVRDLGKAADNNLRTVVIDFAPKDMQDAFLGLGLQDEMELIGPVTKTKGFTDLGNGWYRLKTSIVKDTVPAFLRFKEKVWRVPVGAAKK